MQGSIETNFSTKDMRDPY